jgi:Ser/Thr protein kinase RdoA (MazF antagonist)
VRELRLLLRSLPARFQEAIQRCLDAMEAIFALPMVLLHRDFGTCNIMVDEETCHLTGVIDWAEAEICPFGLNLHSLQSFMGMLHLKNGWTRYEDYPDLETTFWETFKDEVGGLSAENLRTIRTARMMGLLLSHGFTSRLANKSQAIPIGDDDAGRYNMLSLDGFLIDPATRFDNFGRINRN